MPERRINDIPINHSERRHDMDCPFHIGLDDRIRDVEIECVKINEHDKELDILFRYYESMSKDIQEIKLGNKDFLSNQQKQTFILAKIDTSLSDHLVKYTKLEGEFNNFAWFRNQLNWLKERLPWWVLSLLGAAIAILFISLDGLKKVSEVLK